MSRRPHHVDLVRPANEETGRQALIGAHYAMLRRFVLTLTAGDESRAERVVEETFHRAGRDIGLVVHRPGTLRPRLVLLALEIAYEGGWLEVAGHDDRPYHY